MDVYKGKALVGKCRVVFFCFIQLKGGRVDSMSSALMQTPRQSYFEALRIVCIRSIMVLHV